MQRNMLYTEQKSMFSHLIRLSASRTNQDEETSRIASNKTVAALHVVIKSSFVDTVSFLLHCCTGHVATCRWIDQKWNSKTAYGLYTRRCCLSYVFKEAQNKLQNFCLFVLDPPTLQRYTETDADRSKNCDPYLSECIIIIIITLQNSFAWARVISFP